MGIEIEFGVICIFYGYCWLFLDEVVCYLFCCVVFWGCSFNVFLCNGVCLYFDVGSYFEYVIVECDSLVQLVIYDWVGEWVLEDLFVDVEQWLVDEGIGGDIYLFKNNIDLVGNFYGCYENYLIVWVGEFFWIFDVLLFFLVICQLICGVGKVLQIFKVVIYCLS